ncbi:hypothetical protein ACE1SV_34950 [Streptomyces sennicomposti]
MRLRGPRACGAGGRRACAAAETPEPGAAGAPGLPARHGSPDSGTAGVAGLALRWAPGSGAVGVLGLPVPLGPPGIRRGTGRRVPGAAWPPHLPARHELLRSVAGRSMDW